MAYIGPPSKGRKRVEGRDDDPEEASARRDYIHQLRGRILSDTNDLEAQVDGILCVYFEPRGAPVYEEFRSGLLSAVGFGTKVDLLRSITKELGATEKVAGTLGRLGNAVEIRNQVAHSHVTINFEVHEITAETVKEMLQWHSQRWSRKGREWKRIDEAVLEREVSFLARVNNEMSRLVVGFWSVAAGIDLTKGLDDFDRLNPAVAELAKEPA